MITARDVALHILSESEETNTDVPMSDHSKDDVSTEYDKREARHEKTGKHGPTIESVPHDKLRATQSWVHKKWKAGRSKNSEHPRGIKKPDGTVHLVDGHHRANHAFKSGKPFKVKVFHHDSDHIKNWMDNR